MSLNPKSIASLGIGFGAAAVAAVGFISVNVEQAGDPALAAYPGGASAELRHHDEAWERRRKVVEEGWAQEVGTPVPEVPTYTPEPAPVLAPEVGTQVATPLATPAPKVSFVAPPTLAIDIDGMRLTAADIQRLLDEATSEAERQHALILQKKRNQRLILLMTAELA